MKLKEIQRVCIWFSQKRGSTFWQTMDDLNLVFGADCFKERSVRRWWTAILNGSRDRDSLCDKVRSGRPFTARNDETRAIVRSLVEEDRRITLHKLVYETGLSYGTVQKIIKKDLGMSRIAAKFVPKMLTERDRNLREYTSREWLTKIEEDPDILDRVITGDESWVWYFEPETKRESTQWIKRGVDSRPKKFRKAKSTRKVMLVAFFDRHGIVHLQFMDGVRITAEVYINILMNLRDSIRLNRRGLWRDHNWILLEDNASVHTADDTVEFHCQVRMQRGQHPPYSPDLAPCDFFLFPLLKSKLRGRHFPDLNSLKAEVQQVLQKIPAERFARCFQDLKHRWEHCVEVEGNYFEGDPF